MPDPVVNNLATGRISEQRNAPTGSQQQFSRNLCVSNTFKFQTSTFANTNFQEIQGCVWKNVTQYICLTKSLTYVSSLAGGVGY